MSEEQEEKYYYRVYGKMDFVSAYPILDEINKTMSGFGFDEKIAVKDDYHFDLSADRKLTDEEVELLVKELHTDKFKTESIEFLGRR